MDQTQIGLLSRIIDRELAWQASLQLANGALPMLARPTPTLVRRVCPYFSCYAALSLLLRPRTYANHVRRYLDWHLGHLNNASTDYNGVDGTIYDYAITERDDGLIESVSRNRFGKPVYDSTDAYAALLLSLAQAYYTATGDDVYLSARQAELARVYRAMCATFNEGLSFARPDWHVKYLMDNAEVLRGLTDAGRLFVTLRQLTGNIAYRRLSDHANAHARQMANAIEATLWDAKSGYYRVGVGVDGRNVLGKVDPRVYYPDAMAQLMAIVTGVTPSCGERAARLYVAFNGRFSGDDRRWETFEDPDATDLYGIAARTAALVGDDDRALLYLEHYERKVLDTDRTDCLNADRAHVAFAADTLLRVAHSENEQ